MGKKIALENDKGTLKGMLEVFLIVCRLDPETKIENVLDFF